MLQVTERALALAREGFSVFTVRPNKKFGYKGWQNQASTIPNTVEHSFHDEKSNIGIATGLPFQEGYLFVLDVDVWGSKHGEDSLATLEMLYDALPATRKVRTPSGGFHLYFTAPYPLHGSVNQLLETGCGLDIKGTGGLVVAPGSYVVESEKGYEGSYEVVDQTLVAPAPAWLLSLCEKADITPIRGDISNELLDTESAKLRAIDYLKTAPTAYEGGGGNQNTYAVACKVMDFGISYVECWVLMLSDWNDRCSPPWDAGVIEDPSPNTLASIVTNAFAYRTNSVGSLSPHSDFVEVDIPVSDATDTELAPTNKSRLFYIWADQMEPSLEDNHVIEGVLDEGALSVIYGESNSGKTFAVLDMAWSVATGASWGTHEVQQGLVVYLALEGGGQIRKRVKALRQHFNSEGKIPLAIVPCPVDLLRPSNQGGDARAVTKLVAEAEKDFGQRVVLIIVDTLSRAIAGGNENGPEDMTAFISNCDKIREATNAHISIVHHTGKDKARGARGHSSLRAATDTEIEVQKNGEGFGTIRCTKQRDLDQFDVIEFKLHTIHLGVKNSGKEITSCILNKTLKSAAEDFGLERIADPCLEQLWPELKTFISGHEDGVADSEVLEWLSFYNHTHRDDESRRVSIAVDFKTARRNCARRLEKLEQVGLLLRNLNNQWVIS